MVTTRPPKTIVKPTALGPVANTDTKLLIYGLFQKGRVLAQDGVEARLGTLTAGREWFKPWRTIGGEELAEPHLPQLQVMLEGVCAPHRFLALVRDFIVFEDDGSGALVKKMAGYHQFHAVLCQNSALLKNHVCNLMHRKVLVSFYQHLMAEAPMRSV